MFYLTVYWRRARRVRLALAAGLALACLTAAVSPLLAGCASVRSHTLRLHILANSDSAADQALKLDVRDAILARAGSMLTGAATKQEALEKAAEALPEIQAAARDEIARQGYDYPVTVRLENRFFATRAYDGFTLPAGMYDAVRVEIGQSAGRNWFCVLFPPLCVPAALAGEEQGEGQKETAGYTPDEQAAVESPYRISFALVEAVERLEAWLIA